MKCPRCNEAKDLRRSHAQGFWEERVLGALGWFPFRCRTCGHRFHRMGSKHDRARWRKRKRAKSEASQNFSMPGPSDSFEDVVEMLKRAETEALEADEGPVEPEAAGLRKFSRDG